MPGLIRRRTPSEELGGNDEDDAPLDLSEGDESSSQSTAEDYDGSAPREGRNPRKRVKLGQDPDENVDNVEDSWALSSPSHVRPPRARTTTRTPRESSGGSNSSVSSCSSRISRGLPNDHASSRYNNNFNINRSAQKSRAPPIQQWQPGQIVRVSLKNFVTYTSATYPGLL